MKELTQDFLSKSIFLSKATWIGSLLLLFLAVYYLVNIGNRFIQEDKKIKINNKHILKGLAILLGLYLLIRIFQRNNFLYDILKTVLISIGIAYAFNPIINYLEGKNIKRRNGVLILYSSIIAIFFIFSFLVIPRFGVELKRLGNNFPRYLDQASGMMDNLSEKYTSIIGELPAAFSGIEDTIKENINRVQTMLINGLQKFIGSIVGVALKFVNIVLTPILTFYFLVDKDYFKKKITALIPQRHKEDVIGLSRKIDTTLSLFIKGRLLMSLYVGVSTTIMLLILGIDFAIVIGFITGFADIIPYIGPLLGFIPAVFFAALSNPIKVIWVSIFFVGLQWAENNLLAPKIIGDTMDMHPLLILLSIIIGGGVFGVLGMIISVPLVAVIKVVVNFVIEKRDMEKVNSN